VVSILRRVIRKNKTLIINILIIFNRGILILNIFNIESSGNTAINELLNDIIFNRFNTNCNFNIIF